jgi:hypothetical protein
LHIIDDFNLVLKNNSEIYEKFEYFETRLNNIVDINFLAFQIGEEFSSSKQIVKINDCKNWTFSDRLLVRRSFSE